MNFAVGRACRLASSRAAVSTSRSRCGSRRRSRHPDIERSTPASGPSTSRSAAPVEGLTIHAKADVVEYLGNDELLHVTIPGHEGDVIALVPATNNVRPGDSVDLHLPAAKLHLFETESGSAIVTDAA